MPRVSEREFNYKKSFISSKRLFEDHFEEFFKRIDTGGLGIGAYPVDRIPCFGPGPEAAIINTASFSNEGDHWISVYAENGTLEVFDSFGRGPAMINSEILNFAQRYESSSISYNKIQLQDPNSDVCGFYSIFFILKKIERLSLDDVINELLLSSNSDEYVEQVVKFNYCHAEMLRVFELFSHAIELFARVIELFAHRTELSSRGIELSSGFMINKTITLIALIVLAVFFFMLWNWSFQLMVQWIRFDHNAYSAFNYNAYDESMDID